MKPIACVAVCSTMFPISTAAAEPVLLGYFLPKVEVVAVVQKVLTKCPDNDNAAAFEYASNITPKVKRGDYIEIDTRSGVFAERTTTVNTNADGILTGFNSKTTYQAGPLIASLIKAGAATATFGAAALPSTSPAYLQNNKLRDVQFVLRCKKETAEDVAKLAEHRAALATITKAIAAGDTSPAIIAKAADLKTEHDEIISRLILPTKATLTGDKCDKLKVVLPPVDYTKWFELVAVVNTKAPLIANNIQGLQSSDVKGWIEENMTWPGIHGYSFELVPDREFQQAINNHAKKQNTDETKKQERELNRDNTRPSGSKRDLVYLRPVPATAKLYPLTKDNKQDERPQAAPATYSVATALPQLSPKFVIPTGGGGLFGSRTVKASFGPFGEPLELTYERGSSSAGMVSVVDASVTAAQTVRDAETEALKRLLARKETEKKLRELIDSED